MSNSQHRNEPIAIIGSGCRFPGGSNSASTLWELLKNPKDVSQGIGSGGRFNQKQFYHSEAGHTGTTNTERAYLLSENVRNFDAKFFSIPPGEAEAIDPQQRILLEVVYEAVESAGLTINGLSGSDTSCYVGSCARTFSCSRRRTSYRFRSMQRRALLPAMLQVASPTFSIGMALP